MNFLSLLITVLISLNIQISDERQAKFELIIFEGSDWCSNCRRLEKQVLSDSIFLNYLDKEGIKLTRVDFPQRKKIDKEQEKINKKYAEKYKFIGVFPTIILTRVNKLSYKELDYKNKTTNQFIQQIRGLLENI